MNEGGGRRGIWHVFRQLGRCNVSFPRISHLSLHIPTKQFWISSVLYSFSFYLSQLRVILDTSDRWPFTMSHVFICSTNTRHQSIFHLLIFRIKTFSDLFRWYWFLCLSFCLFYIDPFSLWFDTEVLVLHLSAGRSQPNQPLLYNWGRVVANDNIQDMRGDPGTNIDKKKNANGVDKNPRH